MPLHLATYFRGRRRWLLLPIVLLLVAIPVAIWQGFHAGKKVSVTLSVTKAVTKTYVEYQVDNPTGRDHTVTISIALSKGVMVGGQGSRVTQDVPAGGNVDSTLQVTRGARGTAVASVDGKPVARRSF